MAQISVPDTLIFFVNGKKIEDPDIDPELTLLRYLREKLHLTGTKLGCSEGGCGACTVMVSKIVEENGSTTIRHFSINACLTLVVSMYGMAVTTVEGIGSIRTKLHPVQERMAKSHGSQCGFCTPGIVMSMYTLLRNCPEPSMTEIEENLTGNLCRCTGYRPILEGLRTFSSESISSQNGCGIINCCQMNSDETLLKDFDDEMECTQVLFDPATFEPYSPDQDIIFPPELLITKKIQHRSLYFVGPRITYLRPVEVSELLFIKNKYPEAQLVVGNTEVGVDVKYKRKNFPVIVSLSEIAELHQCNVHQKFVEIGAAVTLTDVEKFLKKIVLERKEYETRALVAILEMLRWFAGRQIKNAACIGGNIATSSPISDLNPIFLALGAKLLLQSKDSIRQVTVSPKFFSDYRKTSIKSNEVIISIQLPFTSEDQYFFAYKQSRRRDDDIALANAAFNIELEPHSLVVKNATIAFGGMAAVTILADKTMTFLTGKTLDKKTLESSTSCLLEELKLHPSAPGGMTRYRTALSASFLLQTYQKILQSVHAKYRIVPIENLTPEEENCTGQFQSPPISSVQVFQEIKPSDARIDPVGQPRQHISSEKQTTGEAIYVDDMPPNPQELHGWLVLSSEAKARIISVDASEAVNMEGVAAFFSAQDIPEKQNKYGIMVADEEVFASTEVTAIGQVIGIVVAKCPRIAELAAGKVKVAYKKSENPILTIQDAIKAESYWGPWCITCGDVKKIFESSSVHTIEGESYIGGQEHFYFETNAIRAVPTEKDELEIYCSTQNPHDIQLLSAQACGIASNRVVVHTKRMGGAFGGKDSRSFPSALPVAFVAYKTGCPVRLMLDRHDDMIMTGGRHPYYATWRIAFDSSGMLLAFESSLYSNAGYSRDVSSATMKRSMFCADNSYKIPNMKVTGYCCKTNLSSNTAFRAFGGPQGMFVIEDAVARVADYLNVDVAEVRQKNFYQTESDIHYLGGVTGNCNIQKCWDLVIKQSDYQNRRKAVDEFNRNHRFKKKGICALPIKYPVGFTTTLLNQGGALVLVYRDGSVLVSHGGTEMGQGLHIKMIQVASRALSLNIDRIHILETGTDKVPNAVPTAGSVSSDLYGMAVWKACNEILKNLEPFKLKNPDAGWDAWVDMAYSDRVSLFATGFHKPDISAYNFKTRQGKPFNYNSYGAAVSEVEIDCLTGDHHIIRTDIVMDVGKSLNPAIDIGQIEGAFVQGIGLLTLEELLYSPDGVMLTKGPGMYKIPGFQDIPRIFNVTLLKDSENKKAIYSSKGVGEPPLCLSISVFHAIRDAVMAARKSNPKISDGPQGFRFDAPATCEKIRMACEDSITEQIPSAEPGTFRPWAISA